MKKLLLLLLICFGAGFSAEAQQLTRFAIIDLPRVYVSFFSDSRAVRDFEERSARVQSEIDRMTEEIQNLKVQLVNAQAQAMTSQSSGDLQPVQNSAGQQALRLEAEINRRSEFLREYYQTKTAELEGIKSRLSQSGSFLEQVYDEIRFVAESEGYSVVLNLKESTGILWYTPTIDITDKVIQNLQNKSGR